MSKIKEVTEGKREAALTEPVVARGEELKRRGPRVTIKWHTAWNRDAVQVLPLRNRFQVCSTQYNARSSSYPSG